MVSMLHTEEREREKERRESDMYRREREGGASMKRYVQRTRKKIKR